MSRTALLVGASGLVGGFCLDGLLDDPTWSRVTVLGRRPLPREHPRLRQHTVDFDRLDEFAPWVEGDDVFCCLGTTLRRAGSREAYREVDFTYVMETARLALNNGARQMLLVSAVGADPDSVFFYNRVKGEAECAVQSLGWASLVILRPSLLLGDRAHARLGEEVGKRVLGALDPALRGPLARFRPVYARDVARAMIRVARDERDGIRILSSDGIAEIARE